MSQNEGETLFSFDGKACQKRMLENYRRMLLFVKIVGPSPCRSGIGIDWLQSPSDISHVVQRPGNVGPIG